MTTAILSALPQEQEGLVELLDTPVRVRAAGRDVFTGTLWGRPVAITLSRIGKVAAATTATLLAERFGATRMVFTGVAGGLAAGVRVGDVVVASHLLQHDMDASPLFPRHEIPLYGLTHFACDVALAEGLLQSARGLSHGTAFDAAVRERYALDGAQVHHGLLVSGDRFMSTSVESQVLRQRLPEALAIDMESAAVAQVCHDYGLPFAAVRTISDRADDTAHVDFPAFVEEVASPYARAILQRWLSAVRD
jgi:adenosylhomocysteine nucleosidase